MDGGTELLKLRKNAKTKGTKHFAATKSQQENTADFFSRAPCTHFPMCAFIQFYVLREKRQLSNNIIKK